MDRRKEKGVGNMIDLEQVKKRVEEIAGTRGFCNCCEGKGRMWVAGKIHRATYSEATICCPDCGGSGKIRLDAVSTDELLSLTHDLIAGNETLQREKAEFETVLCKIRQQLSLSFTPKDRKKWLAYFDEVTVNIPTCHHK